jgi:hypothetical protein
MSLLICVAEGLTFKVMQRTLPQNYYQDPAPGMADLCFAYLIAMISCGPLFFRNYA